MHVVVTGGSSGIGAAVARIYAERGADISLIARRPALLETTRDSLAGAYPGIRIRYEAADVRDATALALSVGRCEQALGPCDVLVTSAGIVDPGRFETLDADRFAAQIDTNLMGTVNAVRAVYAGMLARKSGHIVIIASGAGLIGIYGYAAYCASKFGLLGLAEALRQEARQYGVHVSICFPPDTRTPQLEAELRTRPREAAAIIGTAPPWSAELVALAVVKGAANGRFAIYPGLQIAFLARLGPLSVLLRRFVDARIRGVCK